MGDGSLSQDEIDALLQGADDMLSPAGPAPAADFGPAGGTSFTMAEQNAIRDSVGMAVQSAAPMLSGYLGGKNLMIGNPVVEVKSPDAVRADFPRQYVQVALDYGGSVSGKNLVVFNKRDAGSISSLMMGDESGTPPADLSEAHQSTIQEFTNQLLSSMATQIAGTHGGGVSTSPATVIVANNAYDLQIPAGKEIVKVTYDLVIDGIVNSKLYHLMDTGLASGLTRGAAAPPQQHMMQAPAFQQPQMGSVGVSPVKFPPLDEGIPQGVGGNISLILDVPMTLTVELGRTTQLVQDILGLGEGSIIELDKLAGEPVDLLVNGKLIAKGEVVVIDENFGVRVTDIVSPAERLSGIQ